MLPVRGLGKPLFFFAMVGSTNERAVQLAHQDAPHGAVVVAEEQTAGRGRAGRRWFTPPGSALALSIILRPKGLSPGAIGGLTVVGALAVVEVLESLNTDAEIKWPNDVLIGGRKVAGVLVENSWEGDELDFAILGIGVNVGPESIPPEVEINYPTTCVQAAVGDRLDRHELLLAVVEGVARWYPRLGDPEVREAWDRRLAFKDREVRVDGLESEVVGVVQGVSENGELKLELKTGVIHNVAIGDVHLRPVDTNPK